jgi:pentapeptide repeat protein
LGERQAKLLKIKVNRVLARHTMANPEHLEILKRGIKEWNIWRADHLDVKPDLSEANLSGAILSGANLSGANLSGAILSRAALRMADRVLSATRRCIWFFAYTALIPLAGTPAILVMRVSAKNVASKG